MILKLQVNDNNKESININNVDNDICMDRDTNDHFEVSYIVKHKENIDGSIEYFVKWKKYDKKYNSWVKEIDFNSKDLIDTYWNTLKQ